MQPSPSAQRVVVTPASCMRRKRKTLSENDFAQCKLTIPTSLADRLKNLKAAHNMRGLDTVVSAMIRKAMAGYKASELILPPPLEDDDRPRQIAVHIPREHQAYLERVSRHFRGVSLGVALEAVAAQVTDLTPAPKQLSLIEGDAVSG